MVRKFILTASALVLAGTAIADDKPFGGPDSVDYAAQVWQVMMDENMIGENSIATHIYIGGAPHGEWLENFEKDVTVGDHTGALIVKKNYGPATDDDPVNIWNDREGSLAAITIMFKREAGYDPENKDWFWAKYLPDGSLDVNPKGAQLAGRVVKGNDEAGCIACHTAADGGDMVFTHNRYADDM